MVAAHGGACIRIVHVEVRRDRIIARVIVTDERFVYTTQKLIAEISPHYPHLLEHSCVNDRGTTFAAVAHHTSTPHLLEHMAIENQVRADDMGATQVSMACGPVPSSRACATIGGMPATYKGKTCWVDRAARVARIELSFSNDLTALAALRDAARDLNDATAACER